MTSMHACIFFPSLNDKASTFIILFSACMHDTDKISMTPNRNDTQRSGVVWFRLRELLPSFTCIFLYISFLNYQYHGRPWYVPHVTPSCTRQVTPVWWSYMAHIFLCLFIFPKSNHSSPYDDDVPPHRAPTPWGYVC